jgi:hypothetical protein
MSVIKQKFLLPELVVWLSKYPLCSLPFTSLLRVKVRVEISNDFSPDERQKEIRRGNLVHSMLFTVP